MPSHHATSTSHSSPYIPISQHSTDTSFPAGFIPLPHHTSLPRRWSGTDVSWDVMCSHMQRHAMHDVDDWVSVIHAVYHKDRDMIVTGVRHFVMHHMNDATRHTLFTHTLPFIIRLLRDLPASFQHHNVIALLPTCTQSSLRFTQRQCATVLAAAWWDMHASKQPGRGSDGKPVPEKFHTINFKVSICVMTCAE